MKNVHVFVSVFPYANTMLIFQIKRILSSEKWCNYFVPFFFFENVKNLGRSDDGKRRKKKKIALCLKKGGKSSKIIFERKQVMFI